MKGKHDANDMTRYVIAARSINGIVYLMRSGRSWTDDKAKAFRYAKYKTVLRRAIRRFGVLLYDVKAMEVRRKTAV